MYIVGSEFLDKNKKPIEHVYYEIFEDDEDEEELAWARYDDIVSTPAYTKYILHQDDFTDEIRVLAQLGYDDDKDINDFKQGYVYEKTFDYEDMKIAFVVQEFYDNHKEELKDYVEFTTFENCISLVGEIRDNWKIDASMTNLSDEEYAYIQVYAGRYLIEKYLEKESD